MSARRLTTPSAKTNRHGRIRVRVERAVVVTGPSSTVGRAFLLGRPKLEPIWGSGRQPTRDSRLPNWFQFGDVAGRHAGRERPDLGKHRIRRTAAGSD